MRGQQGFSIVLSLVLLIFVILIGVGAFKVMKDIYDKTENEANCATQIRTHAAAVRLTGELKETEIICPTNINEAGDDHKKFLADQMKDCWQTWGKGELRLFGDEEGVYCHICGLTTLEKPVTGMVEYLRTNEVENGVTYEEYLMSTKSGEYDFEQDPDSIEVDYSTEYPIATIFYYAKGIGAYDKLKNQILHHPVVNMGGGLVLSGVLGIYGWVQSEVSVKTGLTGTTALMVAGGTAGVYNSVFNRNDLSFMSAIVQRPMNQANITDLGCDYAPVSN